MNPKTIELIGATAEAMGFGLSESALTLIVADLTGYSDDGVAKALQRLRRDGARFTPAEIIKRLPGMWPGAEQAWASFPRDESQSACVCQEMLSAWGVADGLDEISGRMAFKETYNRAVSEAMAEGGQPKWIMTMGTDPVQRQESVVAAVTNNLLSATSAHTYLPHIPEVDFQALADKRISSHKLLENHAQTINSIDQLLLTHDTPVADAEVAKSHIAEMRKALAS